MTEDQDDVSRETEDQENEDQETEDQENEDQENEDQENKFGREYVQSLRSESAGYRKRMQAAERALFDMQVEATGLIVSAEEVDYDPELLNDTDALRDRVQSVVDSKPYLKKPSMSGNIGQHERKGNDDTGGGLMGMLQQGA